MQVFSSIIDGQQVVIKSELTKPPFTISMFSLFLRKDKTSFKLVFLERRTFISTIETLLTGTRREVPIILFFKVGITA